MASTYTTNLRFVQPVQGELAGTWGDTLVNGFISLSDTSIAGTAAVTMTDADYTLTTANGAADQARSMFITLSGTLTAARSVICPTSSKLYFVSNNTTGGFAITFKTSAGTGVSVANGQRMALYCDGTNVLPAFSYTVAVADGGTGATTGAQALINLGERTGATGSLIVPSGTTGQQDASPAAGYLRFNTSISKFEGYTGSAWSSVGGGATGGGSDAVFVQNGQTVTTSYSIPSGQNAMSTGPITVNSGVAVSIPSGSRWAVL